MRLIAIAATVALLTACASTPKSAPAPAAKAPPLAATTLTATAQPGQTEKFATIDATNITEAQRAGYKVVNESGKQLYCKRDVVTGTRLKYRTTCLTADEMRAVSAQARDAITPKQTPYYAPHP
jgi:hypothetical protein